MKILQTNETYHGPAVDARPTTSDFFQRCQFCKKFGPLKRVGGQRTCQRCHRAVLAWFDAIIQGQVRDDYAENGGGDGELS